MVNLTAKEGFDASSSKGSSIPTGAIIMSAKTYSLNETIQNDRCPCDGRSLNTYDYPNLHKVIGGSYGGAPYIQGITDNSSIYSKNITSASQISTYVFVYYFDNSDGAFRENTSFYMDEFYFINGINYDTASSVIGYASDSITILVNDELIFPSGNEITLEKTFNVPALMPTSSYIPNGDSRDQIYIGGSNTPASLSSALTSALHTHNITGISSPTGLTNNVLDSHTHTVAARTYTTTVNDNNHTFSNPSQGLGNSAGTSQRNDGTTVGAGLAHNHNVNSSTTRTTSPGTTAVPNHNTSNTGGHLGYISNSTSTSASKPAHSHTAAAVDSQSVLNYAGPSYVRVVYYIKL
jgi:hypothetical protein